MAQVKFKKIFENLWKENEKIFKKFFLLNSDYAQAGKRRKIENEFQKVGNQVKEILQKGEDELCRQMEKSQHRFYSSNLADKYWDEVRKYFKYIDLVGVIVRNGKI